MEKVDINQAHEELMVELFGDGYEERLPAIPPVTRSEYTRAMHIIQDRYELKQGHPQFIEWLFTAVGKSPVIIEDRKDEENGTEAD